MRRAAAGNPGMTENAVEKLLFATDQFWLTAAAKRSNRFADRRSTSHRKSIVELGMARTDLKVDPVSAIAPVERETLNDRVYRELKNSIMAGSFKPGSELTLRSVADALGTSLMPVRDAMRRLVSERALEVLPSRKIALPVLTVNKFLELRRIRIMLEGEATALAAGKISPRQLSKCRALLKKLDVLDQDRRGQFWALNQKLHFAIYEAAQSRCCFRSSNRCGSRSDPC